MLAWKVSKNSTAEKKKMFKLNKGNDIIEAEFKT